MGVLALLAVLYARKLVLALAIAVAALIALTAGVFVPKQYASTATVQVDSVQQNLLTGLFEPRVRVNEFLGQQAAIASSRTVALKVIDQLTNEGFFVMADFEAEWRRRTKGELVAGNDPRLWAADQLLKNLEIDADALASTLSLTFHAEDPAQAARIANAFANGYMETILDQRQRRSARNAANFSEETRVLEDELENAQAALSQYRQTAGIVASGPQRLEGEEIQLASLTARLAEARADLSEANSLLRQARSTPPDQLLTLPLPDAVLSGQQAQARLGAILVQLQRLSERYDESYPDYAEALNEKRALETTIMRAVEEHAEFAARRVEALAGAEAGKKNAVVALQETKQTFDVLQKKVEASRQTYDLVATRSLEESLQSRVYFVDVLLLARAVPATRATTPPLLVIVLIGIFVGGAIGVCAAVALEFIEGRIRTKSSLANTLRAPVLAEFSMPSDTLRQAA